MNILYVEDQYQDAEPVLKLLEREYKVTYVAIIDEAYEILTTRAGDFTLVLLDIRMPSGQIIVDDSDGRRTGIKLISQLENDKIIIPIIVYTAIGDQRVLDEIETYENVHGVITKRKPFSLVEKAIKQIMDNKYG